MMIIIIGELVRVVHSIELMGAMSFKCLVPGFADSKAGK